MTSSSNALWSKRFDEIMDLDYIKRKAYIPAIPVENLTKMPVQAAAKCLSDALGKVYVPTRQHCEIIRYLIETAYAHSTNTYVDVQSFLERAYKSSFESDSQTTICITGLSGVGKSSLISAFSRVLPDDRWIDIDENHQGFPLKTAVSLNLKSRNSLGGILRFLAEANFPGELCPKRSDDALPYLAKKLYIAGVSLLALDELQFLTQSNTANAKITQILLALRDLGLPFVYVGNYSLCHRLFKRNDEDKQRLCGNPLILEPEHENSSDFCDQLKELQKVAPDFLCFDPCLDAEQIHRYTGGAIRRIIILFRIASEISLSKNKKIVTISEIENAYISAEYFALRNDVEILSRHALIKQNQPRRDDLYCPYERPKSFLEKQNEQLEREYQERVAVQLVKSSGTLEEQKAYARLSCITIDKTVQGTTLKARRAKKALSNKELLSAFEKLKDEL